jgi:hypothetical protein
VLAHCTPVHVGRRTSEDANIFAAKLSTAVSADRFQVSTDGFEGYPAALEAHFGGQIDLCPAHQILLRHGIGLRTAVFSAVHNSH